MDGKEIRVAEVCEEWLNMKRLSVKQSTWAHYNRIVRRHILPELGEMRLEEISSSVVNRFIYEKLEHGRVDRPGALAAKTVRDICLVLRSVLHYGEEEYCLGRLAGNTVLPKKKAAAHEVLSEKELRQIRQWLLDHSTDARGAGLLVCMYTGMRLGEICALRWSDIDLKRRMICISQTMQRVSVTPEAAAEEEQHRTCVIFDEPKTVASFRVIPIPSELYPILCEMRKECGADGYFLTGSQRFVEPRNYQYFFKRVLKKAEVREVNFHILRHTFATRCVELGMDVKTLSEILGHSNTSITLNYYVHSTLESKRRQLNRFRI